MVWELETFKVYKNHQMKKTPKINKITNTDKDCKDCQRKDKSIETFSKVFKKNNEACEQLIKKYEAQLENSQEIRNIDNRTIFMLNSLLTLLPCQDCKNKIKKITGINFD
jgi:membrane-associated HD superfamily phosphohydrolase